MIVTVGSRNFEIAESEFQFSAVRSRGPGGQNVNKVSSAAQLHWAYLSSPGLSESQKKILKTKLKNHINVKDEIYLRSDAYRDFPRNREECIQKLQEMIEKALHKPKPRKKTKPTKASQRKRVESKSERAN